MWHASKREPANDDLYIKRIKEFFERFGTQVENLSMRAIVININLLTNLLTLMPNLIKLKIHSCNVYIRDADEEPSQIEILELTKLEEVSLDNVGVGKSRELLDSLLCPSIQTFQVCAADISACSKFFRRHKQLKDVDAHYTSGFDDSTDFQFEHLCPLRLEILTIFGPLEASKVCTLIKKQPQITELAMTADKADALRQIVKLKHLESLQLEIKDGLAVPEQLIRDILRMPKLKRLAIFRDDVDIAKAIFTAEKNLQLEWLTFNMTKDSKHELLKLASTFPNLKRVGVSGCMGNLNAFMRLKNLKFLHIDYLRLSSEEIDESEVNESVRELKAYFTIPEISKMIRMMPNIEKLVLGSASRMYPYFLHNTGQAMDEVLSMRNLIEIGGDHAVFLDRRVIVSINNCAGTSKLQRISFRRDVKNEWKSVIAAYEKQFPFKRLDFDTLMITMSRT